MFKRRQPSHPEFAPPSEGEFDQILQDFAFICYEDVNWAADLVRRAKLSRKTKMTILVDKLRDNLLERIEATGEPIYPAREMVFEGEPVDTERRQKLRYRFGRAVLGIGNDLYNGFRDPGALPYAMGYNFDAISTQEDLPIEWKADEA